MQCLQTPNHPHFYSTWWEGEKPEELSRLFSSVEINTRYSILILPTYSFLWMLMFPMDTHDRKKNTYNLTERLLTWQKGSGDCKCDLGPEEKEGWNKWKMLSSSSLWPGLGLFFSFLKTHIRFNPDIGTFTPPNILHLISDRPCVINLCKRVSIGFAKVRGSGKDRDHAKAAAGMKNHAGLPTPAVGNVLPPDTICDS